MNFKNVLVWAATIFLAIIFIMSGVGKLLNLEMWYDQFANHWGVPAWMVPITAVMEVVGGVLILVPKWGMYGGGLLVFVMVGGTGTHIMAAEWPNAGFAFFLLVLAASVANMRRLQAAGGDG